MSSLLDSRAHHTCVHVLSRKAWENEIYDGEPSHRQYPDMSSNNVEHLSGRQRGQRERRRRERNERIQTVDHGSANDSIRQIFNHISNTPLTQSRRKKGQLRAPRDSNSTSTQFRAPAQMLQNLTLLPQVLLPTLAFPLEEVKGRNEFSLITHFICTPVPLFPGRSSGKR